jgi:hypothetical protein
MTQPCGFSCHLIWQRMAHNPEVAGSNPAPATGKALETGPFCFLERDRSGKLLPDFCPGVPVGSRGSTVGQGRGWPSCPLSCRRWVPT